MNNQEIINFFKTKEKTQQIIPMITDTDLQKLISAWEKINIIDRKPDVYVDKTANLNDIMVKIWGLLWKNYYLDDDFFIQLGGAINKTPLNAKKLFWNAVANQLIYPDNTINKYANQFLGKIVFEDMRNYLDYMEKKKKKK